MHKLRMYGKQPYTIALIHGGPGAPGEMAPVAHELAAKWGVLEPFQSALSIAEQVAELKMILRSYGALPMTLIGFSWGAWLAVLFAATHPEDVAKLIIIGSGSFEQKYIGDMHAERLERLCDAERRELSDLMEIIPTQSQDAKRAFTRAGQLFLKADAYDPLPVESEIIDYQVDVYRSIWPAAAELRRSGELLASAARIQCPLVAIHGTHDPHPSEGVRIPLESILADFRFILLERCGHKPWIERQAKQRFYEILHAELRAASTA